MDLLWESVLPEDHILITDWKYWIIVFIEKDRRIEEWD